MPEPLGEADAAVALRQQLIDTCILPYVQQGFGIYAEFRSAALLLSRYPDQRHADAVHVRVLFSELDTPDCKAWFAAEADGWADAVNWPSQPCFKRDYGEPFTEPEVPLAEACLRKWDAGGLALEAFAGLCPLGPAPIFPVP
ncbi:MAG: hypothetical protein ACAI44_38495, partial [Candidatus Sericytochromatia bacterium]